MRGTEGAARGDSAAEDGSNCINELEGLVMAGESARASAKRLREKAERQARVAAMFERGAEGEEATATALAALPSEEWAVFHDLRWPGRKFANVDHIVVGPPGVYVIDSKNWTGSIDVADNVLRQNGRAREAAVHGAAEAAMAVSGLARSVSPLQVHPVLCFVREEPVAGWARDVVLCSTSNLVQMLTSRDRVLSDDVRQMVTLELDAALRSATEAPVAVTRPAPSPRYYRDPQHRAGSPYRAPSARRRRPGCVSLIVGLMLIFVGLSAAVSLIHQAVESVSHPSVPARSDGSCPALDPVKAWAASTGEKLYRAPGAKGYDRARAQTCFADADHAASSGYAEAKR